jgi:hypothetical protein
VKIKRLPLLSMRAADDEGEILRVGHVEAERGRSVEASQATSLDRAVSAVSVPTDALALRNREPVSHTTLIILKEGRRYIAGTNRRRVGLERGFSHGSKSLFQGPAGAI